MSEIIYLNDGTQAIQVANVKRKATTIQTHAAVSVALSSNSVSATWIDCDGFTEVAINMLNDANTSFACSVIWSTDGVNTQGADSVFSPGNGAWGNARSGVVPVKARYLKVIALNSDAGAAHVMSAWAYLKA